MVNARALSARAWDWSTTRGYQDLTNVCCILLKRRVVRAILLDINGEKRPEKTKDYFIVSNSTLFEINVIFIYSKPMFPIAHGAVYWLSMWWADCASLFIDAWQFETNKQNRHFSNCSCFFFFLIITCVSILKQLFASGAVNIGEYSTRLCLRKYSPIFTAPEANNCMLIMAYIYLD